MNKKLIITILVMSAVTIGAGYFIVFKGADNGGGESSSADEVLSAADRTGPAEAAPSIDLLYPQGRDQSDYEVVLISPPGVAPSYTYLDRLEPDGPVFKVTQQEVPETFDLEATAADFQATSVIQVDSNKIYHGYNARDTVQSLIFEKNGLLVSIRSPYKYSDDLWTAYYLSLN